MPQTDDSHFAVAFRIVVRSIVSFMVVFRIIFTIPSFSLDLVKLVTWNEVPSCHCTLQFARIRAAPSKLECGTDRKFCLREKVPRKLVIANLREVPNTLPKRPRGETDAIAFGAVIMLCSVKDTASERNCFSKYREEG